MMKKTQFADAIRNIRKRLVSYLSICLVIMLGVGAFLATRYMEAGIVQEAAGYYSSRNFKDFELISSLGISEKNIETIKAVEGVTDAEGVMEFEGSLSKGEVKSNVTVLSRTTRVSTPLLTDGTMPLAKNECAVGEDLAEKTGIVPGDKVTLYLKSAGGSDPLYTHEFTVTGLIKHPDYVHRKLTDTVILPLEAFDMSVTDDAYTRVFVRAEDVAFEDYFTQSYFDQVAPTKKALKDLTSVLAKERADEVKAEALEQIDKEWAEAEAELEEAQREIDAGEDEMNSKLAKGRKELIDAENELAAELKKAAKELKKGKAAIEKYEKKLAKAKKDLKKAKKAYKKIKDIFRKSGWMDDALTNTDYLLEHYDDDPKPDDYNAKEKELAAMIIEHQDELREIAALSKEKDVTDAAKELKDKTDIDIMPYIDDIRKNGVEDLIAKAEAIQADDTDTEHFTKEELEGMKAAFEGIRSEEAAKALKKAKEDIDDAEKEIAAGEKLLNQNKAKYNSEKNRAAREKAKAEKKIDDGWTEYYSQKKKYEGKLAEAKALLAENREEAEKKLAEAKAEVEEIECEWLVLDRNANAGYIDVKAQLDSLRATGLVFGILFILITALVCFSTLTIIIEEQKKLIGTVKAFGFHKREVLSKYLLFGTSAGLLGDILAVFTGIGLSVIVQIVYSASNLYQYGHAGTIVKPVPTILITVAMLIVCAVASVIACTGILRSPASLLMNGQTLKRRRERKKVSSSRRGSLYSRLILRNIRNDKARVIVSTAIVAFCCMLIGVGFSFKLSFSQMVVKQENNVNLYDLRMDIGDSVTDEQRARLKTILENSGVDYTEVVYESHIFVAGDTSTGLTVLAADPQQITKYLGIRSETGTPVDVTDDGILLPVRMTENYGYSVGDSVSILDSNMQSHDATMVGAYTNYFGRVVITTPKGYKNLFDEEYEPNSCYIILNGENAAELRSALLAVNEDISFDASDSFKASVDSVSMLYNIIVYVTLGVSIFMSFMILTNLANIFITRKKNELTVMRVNGFSVKQTIGYLAKETRLMTIIGLALGVLVGSLLSPLAIKMLEPADLQFDRSYHVIAWIAAAGIEGLFALIIYSLTFRKVRKLNLRDIA